MEFMGYKGLIACLALAGCSNLSRSAYEDDSLSPHLSVAQREEIGEAHAEQGHRRDELTAARQDAVHARADYALATRDLCRAEARARQAEAGVVVAEKGTAVALQEARLEMHLAQADMVAHTEWIRWHESEITRCERAKTLAEREQELAVARFGLVKARAFVQVDRAASRSSDVACYEAQVDERGKQASLARVELEVAQRECTRAQRRSPPAPVD